MVELVYTKGVNALSSSDWLKDAVWVWNSLGLYDLVCMIWSVPIRL
jgi:hypothetical protein